MVADAWTTNIPRDPGSPRNMQYRRDNWAFTRCFVIGSPWLGAISRCTEGQNGMYFYSGLKQPAWLVLGLAMM